MRVDDLIASVAPAYCDSWAEAIDELVNDQDEAETVAALRAVLASGGEFTTPVVIQDGRVCNGMHRIVASVLEGRDTVTVVDQYPPAPDTYFEVMFTADPIPPGDPGEDLINRVFARVRSFPLDGGWAEALGCGLFRGMFEGVWSCPPHVNGAALADTVVDRLDALGLQGQLVNWSPWTDEP